MGGRCFHSRAFVSPGDGARRGVRRVWPAMAARGPRVPTFWRSRAQVVGLGNLDHVRRLLGIPGIDVNIRDDQGRTALHILPQLVDRWQARKAPRNNVRAMARRWLQTSFQALVDAGADVSATDHSGYTPLHRVCWYAGWRDCNSDAHVVYTDGSGGEGWAHWLVKQLLAHGADPNARTADGAFRTAGHVLGGRLQDTAGTGQDLLHLLLAAGADFSLLDHEGNTAWHTMRLDVAEVPPPAPRGPAARQTT